MQPLSAEIRLVSGRPMIYVDGRPRVPLVYALSDIPASKTATAQAQRNIGLFAAQGMNLVQIDAALLTGWRKTGDLDLDFLTSEIAGALAANPDAEIFIRLHVNAPYWWMRDNPDELVVYGSASAIDTGEFERLIANDYDNRMRVSLASEKWLADAGIMLGEACRRLAASPEGCRVIGIQIACGVYGEWHHWGTGYNPDYSAPMQRRFRRFLTEKYGSDAALQLAWHDPGACCDRAELSPPDTRFAGSDGMFRDPAAEHAAMDSLKCLQLTVPEAIIHFCRIVRQSWNRPVLIGSFYGYFFGSCRGLYATIGGHLEVDTLYQSGAVDFLCAPFPYFTATRCIRGVSVSRGLHESARLNGLLWLTEMDQHPIGTGDFVGGDPAHRRESIALLRRDVLESITHGMGCWYYDHRLLPSNIYRKSGWWDHPELLSEVRRLYRIGEKYALSPFRPTADVALIFDTDAYYYMPHNALASREIEERLLDTLGHTGVAYDCIYLHDIRNVDWSVYKCVVFVNTVQMDACRRRFIRDTIARGDRHLVWIHAAGYFDEWRSAADNISGLTGIKVKKAAVGFSFRSCGTLLPALSFSVKEPFDPMFVPDLPVNPVAQSPDTQLVGIFPESGIPAAACRRLPDSTAWFFSLPPLHAGILRELFRLAGAHVYSDGGETILAGSGLVVITAVEDEVLTLRLRSGHTVTTGLAPMTTAVFDAETGVRIE